MSRFQRFLHGVVSSYAVLIATALYSILSIPIALRYLSTAEFGLWAVGMQIAAYLAFVDVGMSPSVTRLLVDHKDDRANGAYGGMILTGVLVSGIQGALILIAGAVVGLWGSSAFGVPLSLQGEFTGLMAGLGALTAATFFSRVFGQLLHAHQRSDLTNYFQIASLLVNLAAMWLAFEFGAGVFSLLIASAVAWVVSLGAAFPCRTLGLWPRQGEWGRPNWRSFREMFTYGTDVFLIAVGTQLINYSHIIIVSQTRGIEAAAVWTVMTKPFTLVAQLAWRPIGLSLPAYAEMLARGETVQFWRQYRLLFTTVNASVGFLAVLFAFANGPFVALWTSGKMAWPFVNDCLLGLWLVLLTQVCCHNSIFMVEKKIGWLKYVYFVEALAFVGLGLTFTRWSGFPGLIGCSIVCTGLFTFLYASRRMTACIRDSGDAWLFQAQRPLFLLLSLLIPTALLLRIILDSASPALQLALGAIPLAGMGLACLIRFCLPSEVTLKILRCIPRPFQPVLKKLAALPTAE